jgi:hypothetical protein
MKVTIELNDAIIDAIAQTTANDVALSWWEACGLDTNDRPISALKSDVIKCLYKNAFGDGIRFLVESQK